MAEASLEKLTKTAVDAALDYEYEGKTIREWVQEISEAGHVGKWTPVSERLPEKDGEYLLYGKIEDDEENYIFLGDYDACAEEFGIWQEQFDRYSLGCLGSEFYEYNSVLAWMPLPEPYKQKESENET